MIVMKKKYKSIFKIAGIVILVLLGVFFLKRYSTKAYSPEKTVTYEEQSLELEVFYNRPFKKNREIFGRLVPYGEVWRTGANEATTFYTSENLLVDGSLLEAGKYTLWTIPKEDSWKVIFNSKMYPWGINQSKKAYRDPAYDVLVLEVQAQELQETIEQFSIFFEKANDLVLLNIAWDHTEIEIPLKAEKEAHTSLL